MNKPNKSISYQNIGYKEQKFKQKETHLQNINSWRGNK